MRKFRYFLTVILAANALFLAVVVFQAFSENFDDSFLKQLMSIEEVQFDPFRNFVPFEDETDSLLVTVESSYRSWNEGDDSSRVLHLVKKMSRYQDEAIATTAATTPRSERQPSKLKN